MKTTVEIADPLLAEAKRAADRRGTTLRALIEEGLRHVLKSRRADRPFRLRDGSFQGDGLQAGIREGDWEQIRSLIYEGHGG
jgi:hypothetical protein